MIEIVPPNFAIGYSPVQYCWPTARNPIQWDELSLYASRHPLLRSVVKLARAKILQALMDISSQSKKPEARHYANEAWNWIFSDRGDFRAFCSDAGYSPMIVRHKAKEIMENGLNWRAEAGQGDRYGRIRSAKKTG